MVVGEVSGESVCPLRGCGNCGWVTWVAVRCLASSLSLLVSVLVGKLVEFAVFDRHDIHFLCVGCIRIIQIMHSILVWKRLIRLGLSLEKLVGGVVGEVCLGHPFRNMALDAQRLGRRYGFFAGYAVDALACGVGRCVWPGRRRARCPPKSP